MPIVYFADTRRKVECVPGANLRELALSERYPIYKGFYRLANCRGHGLCGSCRVAVLKGRTMPRNDVEKRRLKNVPEPWRLACQVEVLESITVTADEGLVAEAMAARETQRQAPGAEPAAPARPAPKHAGHGVPAGGAATGPRPGGPPKAATTAGPDAR